MADAKTKPTKASVEEYIASRASQEQRADSDVLLALFKRITEEEPRMWGPSIVGFGSYNYTYESGRSGTSCLVGFAIRGREFAVYLAPYWEGAAGILTRLGKHRMGKGCLYFKRIADLDQSVFEELIVGSVNETYRRHGKVDN